MRFLSQCIGLPVRDPSGEPLGSIADLIVAIGGTPVTTADEIRATLAAHAGTPTRVTVRRGAVRMDLALDG